MLVSSSTDSLYLCFWREGFPFYHKTHRSLGRASSPKVEGKLTFCQVKSCSQPWSFNTIWIEVVVKSLFYFWIPKLQAIPILPGRLQVSAGAKMLPFSARKLLGGKYKTCCTNTLSLSLPINQHFMDVMSYNQAFHLFGSSHLPDFLLGMILHKSIAP